jgi:hypothetical protein
MPNVARPLNAAMESKGTIGKQLTFYGATCDREIYDECVVASLACTTPGDFSAEVTNFSNREVASWLTSSGPVASLTINAQEFALSTSNISYSEMDGGWVISFPDNSGHAGDIWVTLIHGTLSHVWAHLRTQNCSTTSRCPPHRRRGFLLDHRERLLTARDARTM